MRAGPGSRVAASATGTLVANAWNTLTITAPLLAGTNYWLMFNTNGRTGSVNNMRYNTGAAGQGAYSTGAVPFGTWPATFPAVNHDQLRVFIVCHVRPIGVVEPKEKP